MHRLSLLARRFEEFIEDSMRKAEREGLKDPAEDAHCEGLFAGEERMELRGPGDEFDIDVDINGDAKTEGWF